MSARSEALAARLSTAISKAERREAVGQFMSSQTRTEDVRARVRADRELRTFMQTASSRVVYQSEARDMGEGTATAGGYLLKPLFGSVIRYLKEFQALLGDMEELETATGAAYVRPQVSAFDLSGEAQTEGVAITDGTDSLITFAGQQSYDESPTYATLMRASNQLMSDAFTEPNPTLGGSAFANGGTLERMPQEGMPGPYLNRPASAPFVNGAGGVGLTDLLASAAAENIGRQVASVASTALYAAATDDQEVSITSVTNANVAKLFAGIDPAYLPGARLYVSPGDYAKLIADDPVKLRALPAQVVPTNAVTDYVADSVSGPVLADLGNFMTFRHVNSLGVVIDRERYAEYLQTAVIVYLRADFEPTGRTAAAVFST